MIIELHSVVYIQSATNSYVTNERRTRERESFQHVVSTDHKSYFISFGSSSLGCGYRVFSHMPPFPEHSVSSGVMQSCCLLIQLREEKWEPWFDAMGSSCYYQGQNYCPLRMRFYMQCESRTGFKNNSLQWYKRKLSIFIH